MSQEQGRGGTRVWALWAAVAVAGAAGLSAAALLALRLLPRGIKPVWEWPLRAAPVPVLPWTLLAAAALLVVGLIALDSVRSGKAPSRLGSALLVACLTVCSATLMGGMIADDPDFAVRAPIVVLGDMSMGYYQQAVPIHDVREYIRDVPARCTALRVPDRVATHPPGPVLYHLFARRWLQQRPELLARLDVALQLWSRDEGLGATTAVARRLTTRPMSREDVPLAFWPALALTFTAPLIVPLAFALGAAVSDRRLGLTAAVPACALPALACFAPSVDGPTAALAAAGLAAWMWALRSGSRAAAAACGALLMVGLWWSFGLVALGPVLVVTAALQAGGWRARRLPRLVAGLCAGALVVALAGWLGAGYNPLTSMVASLRAQGQLTSLRPYAASIPWNLYEFVLFAGPALVILAAAGSVAAWKRPDGLRAVAALGLGLGLTLAALLLAGGTRGEVGRIWGLLMPPLALPAAAALTPLRGWGFNGAGMVLLAAQLALLMAMNSQLSLVAP